MSKRLLLSFISLLVSWGVYASDISVKNEQGVEIWYDFDADDKTASVTFKGNYFYSYSGWYSGDVVIPAMVVYGGEEYKVTSIGEDAFRGCSGLTSVTIPESVTSIEYATFSGCSGITSVTIPESVTMIGDYAFYSCSGLTSVAIPDGVTSIGGYAFDCCYKLYEVYNKSSLNIVVGSEENGYVAYYAKNVYTDESGESKLHTVGDYVFYADGDDIDLLAYIGDETELTLPSDYEGKSYEIAGYAFYDCSGLTSVMIPESVTSIGQEAFRGCSGLTSIEVSTDNKNYCSVDGVLFDKTTETLIAYPAGKKDESYSIPDGVTSIGKCAFEYCSGLTSVTIPESVTSIGDYAFFGCYRLYEVYNKSSLNIVVGSEENGDVAYYAKNVYTDESGESKLHTVGDYLFYTEGDDIVLLSYLGDETSITLPSDYEGKSYEIADYAFYNCSGLTSVTISEGVTSIGGSAFVWCAGLTYITIPESVTSIGLAAFANCSGLTSVTIPESITSIGDYAFGNCSGLISVTIPEGVTKIGRSVFEGCSKLTDVTIPKSVTLIGEFAFYNCHSLTSVTIPESVTSIGNAPFFDCSGLTSVICMNTIPPSVIYSAFNGVDKSIPLYVPKQSVEAYKSADYWKEFTNILAIDEEPNAISVLETDDISIRLIGNRLIVENTDDYAVYALSGQCFGKVESLERGVYIVVANGVSKKIVVK